MRAAVLAALVAAVVPGAPATLLAAPTGLPDMAAGPGAAPTGLPDMAAGPGAAPTGLSDMAAGPGAAPTGPPAAPAELLGLAAGRGATPSVLSDMAADLPTASADLPSAAAAAVQQEAPISIEPAVVQVEVGGTHPLVLRSGGRLDPASVRWISRDRTIATVDATGLVRGVNPGTARIMVLVGQRIAEATVRVAPPAPASIEVEAGADVLLAGTGAPLRVVVRDAQDDPLPLPPAQLRFETAPASVATVDAAGRLAAHSPGTVTITARAGEATGRTQLRVVENPAREFRITGSADSARTGDVLRFRVEARDAAGREVGPLLPAWSVDRPGARIDAEHGQGVFVAEEPGRYTVTAYLGPAAVERTVVDIAPRIHDGHLIGLGHGLTAGHHAGDTWAFEGADGRDYAIIGTFMHDWAKVFDITEPTRPVLTDSIRLDARRINDVKIHGSNRLAVLTREGASTRRNGIVILDLSTPAHPTILAEYTETVTGGVHNVWIEGDLIYACHNGTSDLRIIDISDPRSPREVGRWGLPNEDRSLHDVIVQDGYAYLSYWNDGLIMLDVGAGTHGGTPTRPEFVSRFRYPQGNTHTAWRYGRYLFIGDEIFPDDWDSSRPIEARGYIHVVDYSDPENPVEVARYEVPEAGVHNFWVEDDILYVGYYQAGLRVVDVSGELRGDLYRQGREMGALRTSSPDAVTPNWSMTWGAQLFKGNIITSDLNSGLWVARYVRRSVVF